jgi:hypothetical protein
VCCASTLSASQRALVEPLIELEKIWKEMSWPRGTNISTEYYLGANDIPAEIRTKCFINKSLESYLKPGLFGFISKRIAGTKISKHDKCH